MVSYAQVLKIDKSYRTQYIHSTQSFNDDQ